MLPDRRQNTLHQPHFILVSVALSAALGLALSPALPAQTGASAPKSGGLKIGTVVFDARSAQYRPGLLHLSGQVKITSADYDLAGEDIKLFSTQPSGGGKATLKNAVVEGDPAAGKQVVAHIRQPLQGQAYEIFADHAVYAPDNSRPGGGRMDFTGHVKVITNSGFLAEPSVTNTDHATILMGQGDDYPQVLTGPAHIVLTPAQ